MEVEERKQELERRMSIYWGLKDNKNVFKVRSILSKCTKNSNNYELIDYFCRIITLNCDALRVEISSTVNPNEVGHNKNRILRIRFGFF